MTEAEIFQVYSNANAAIQALYGQVISINFAMVVAIFYFLNRSGPVIKTLAFVVYLIGTFMFVGLMLEESNIKAMALRTLAAIPATAASPMTADLLGLSASWLFATTAVFLNGALWTMAAAVAFLLFAWKKPAA